MHIVQIIDLLRWGGAQKLLITFASEARSRHLKLTVVSLQDDRQQSSVAEQLETLGVRVVTFPGKVRDLKRIWTIADFLRHESCDVVHTHLTSANLIGTLAGRLAKVPTVASLHNVRSNNPYPCRIRSELAKKFETFFLRHGARRIIAVGQLVAQTNQDRFNRSQITVVPNAVEDMPTISAKERLELRTEISGDPERPLILSVGQLSAQKGYRDLLTAFAALHRNHPTATLAIAGRGTLHDQLTKQIEFLGLTNHARLLGRRDDVPRLMAASDIFVSSSHWEGLPIVVLEAMAAGLPVVGTKVGDVPKVVVEGAGLLAPPRQPAALADRLSWLLDHPEKIRQFGQAAQELIKRNYNAATWVDRLLRIYRQAQNVSEMPHQQEQVNL